MMNPFIVPDKEAPALTPGTYPATFIGAEAVEATAEYREGTRWKWKVVGSEATASRITRKELRSGTTLWEVLEWLKGSPLVRGEAIDPASFVGRTYAITVGPTKGKGVKVVAAKPMPRGGE